MTEESYGGQKMLYAVMGVYRFDRVIEVTGPVGVRLAPWPKDCPQRFIPLFDTRAEAEAWSDGEYEVALVTAGVRKEEADDGSAG